jgi:DNA-binding transcriptional MerR regulator
MASRSARPSRSNRHKPAAANSGGDAAARPLKIGEAAKALGVEAYVLRFWETQFPELRPYHTASKHRLYRPQDVEILRLIKHLLYEEGFTIEGARKRIKEVSAGRGHEHPKAADRPAAGKGEAAQTHKSPPVRTPVGVPRQALIEIRRDLESLYALLKS